MEFEFYERRHGSAALQPLPAAMLRLPISSTAKSHVCPSAEHHLTAGIEDSNGILFVRFPIMELAAALSRSPVNRSVPERIGGHRAYPAGAPGVWENQTAFTRQAASQRRAAMINEKLEKLNQEIAKAKPDCGGAA